MQLIAFKGINTIDEEAESAHLNGVFPRHKVPSISDDIDIELHLCGENIIQPARSEGCDSTIYPSVDWFLEVDLRTRSSLISSSVGPGCLLKRPLSHPTRPPDLQESKPSGYPAKGRTWVTSQGLREFWSRSVCLPNSEGCKKTRCLRAVNTSRIYTKNGGILSERERMVLARFRHTHFAKSPC